MVAYFAKVRWRAYRAHAIGRNLVAALIATAQRKPSLVERHTYIYIYIYIYVYWNVVKFSQGFCSIFVLRGF